MVKVLSQGAYEIASHRSPIGTGGKPGNSAVYKLLSEKELYFDNESCKIFIRKFMQDKNNDITCRSLYIIQFYHAISHHRIYTAADDLMLPNLKKSSRLELLCHSCRKLSYYSSFVVNQKQFIASQVAELVEET